MKLDTNSTGANSTNGEILSSEYGYKNRWSGSGGGDPRQTSFQPNDEKIEAYSHNETADAANRNERPLMEAVEGEILGSAKSPSYAGE